MKKVVIALGGNALQARGEAATSENQLRNVMATAEHIARIIGEGYEVIISHGNGPQVGRLMLQNEAGKSVTPPMPMDVCGAMTQGMIGYHIQQGLSQVLRENGIDKPVCTVVTPEESHQARRRVLHRGRGHADTGRKGLRDEEGRKPWLPQSRSLAHGSEDHRDRHHKDPR